MDLVKVTASSFPVRMPTQGKAF
ncbi:rCG44158 [Rattus norvegicus]|uniref:RCG44158 n=1 Tax=Rattus norvegicus TaxID=10116 RepID=A6J6Q6_RAT|nr:rCG44158 [Rattus norvegicus]